MRRDDRDKIVEALGPKVPSHWKIQLLGPGADDGPGSEKRSRHPENGVQLVSASSDIIRLVGVTDKVRRADRVLRVFRNGRVVPELGGGSYKGRGWHERAIDDVLKMVVFVDGSRINHQSVMLGMFDGKIPNGMWAEAIGEAFSKGGGVQLTNRYSDVVRVVMVDDEPDSLIHEMKVFIKGRRSDELSGATFDGVDWHAEAAEAAIAAAVKIQEERS